MTTPNTAQEPTPWTDAAERDHSNLNDDCRTLERHLRRIVEAADKHGCGGPVRDAIQAAKEELSK